jgi:2-alkyl-3-oxoalkanoate reductase
MIARVDDMSETTALSTAVQPLSVFVTHGDSVVGRALVRQLVKRGAKVAASTANGTHGAHTIRQDGGVPTYTDLHREADIKSTLLMTKADVVIDLSATALNHIPLVKNTPNLAHLNNVPLLNACHAVGVKKLIYISSVVAYGDTHGASVDETAPLSRENDFFRALARAESVLLNSDFNVFVLRSGYLYGGHTPALDAIATMVTSGRPAISGKGVNSFTHVDDLTSAILKTVDAESLPNRLYNIVDDAPISFDGFVAQLGEGLGVGAPLYLPVLSSLGISGLQESLLNQSTLASNARAKAELGWTPQYPSQQHGIERMLMTWRAEEAPAETPTSATSMALVKA